MRKGAKQMPAKPANSGIRTPWRVVWKRLRCYFSRTGHKGEIIHCGDLLRLGHREAPLQTCTYCNEILMMRFDVQKHGNKEA